MNKTYFGVCRQVALLKHNSNNQKYYCSYNSQRLWPETGNNCLGFQIKNALKPDKTIGHMNFENSSKIFSQAKFPEQSNGEQIDNICVRVEIKVIPM